ncbi:MAG: hypothetical protein NT149_04635 [Candidatus Gottesmanbacteria bacterium]|nr:hypothetical protein [Candidatus Gottesmanbacteria bacterium]
MPKEIHPIDLFDIADQSNPFNVAGKDWARLAGSIYGAMRRGRSASDIWGALSFELYDAPRHGDYIKAELLAPYVAKLLISINNLAAADGEKITLEQLKRARASPAVNEYLK